MFSSNIAYFSEEISATSPSSKNMNWFVSWAIANGSEAAKYSSAPNPIKRGDLLLAITIFESSSLSMAAIAYAPSSLSFVLYIESIIEFP